MGLSFIKGDLLESETIIGHGVNTRGLMGGGIARKISQKYPWIMENYIHTCANDSPEKLLGTPQFAFQQAPVKEGIDEMIVNLFTQKNPGADANLVYILASLNRAMIYLPKNFGIHQLSIPMIGAGIGGLNPAHVKDAFRWVSNDHPDFELQVYSLD